MCIARDVEARPRAILDFHNEDVFMGGELLAVYGQLAGAYYGADDIPGRWRSKLAHLDTLENFAARLWTSASR